MMNATAEDEPVVFVIDDDASMRDALGSLFRSLAIEARFYGSTQEFMDAGRPDAAGCIVLDVRLPGRNGLDFQGDLARSGIRYPIVFITAHGDVPMSVRAMKAGAIEFLTKPFSEEDLLKAVQLGIERDRERRNAELALADLRNSYAQLTPREREIMAQVVDGRLNKQIAASLGLSEITVKVHRGHLMHKLGARSLPDLVRMAERLGGPARRPSSDDTRV
jgi:FixJ family two-component response regulator